MSDEELGRLTLGALHFQASQVHFKFFILPDYLVQCEPGVSFRGFPSQNARQCGVYTWFERWILIDTVRETLKEGTNIPLCAAGIEVFVYYGNRKD